MTTLILRRLMMLPLLLLGISVIVFILMSLSPGDFLTEIKMRRDITPEHIEALKVNFGLDHPWYIQYFYWLKSVCTGDFGESWKYKVQVLDLIKQRAPATILLSLCSVVFAWGIAVPLGVLAAIYKGSIFDRISSWFAYAFLSLPEFFLALLMVYFAAKSGWFPIGGMTSFDYEFLTTWGKVKDIAHHMILPTFVLGIGGVAGMMRIMRANFLDVIRSEYVMTARAKGLSEGRVLFIHVLRNAINPLISLIGFVFAGLLSGALLVENVMNYPGLGQLTFQAFLSKDQYLVMGSIIVGSGMLIVGNLLSDLLLAWSDPRIRYEK